MIVNTFFAFYAGTYHGLHKSQGIDIDINTFEGSTLYAPLLLMGGLASIKALKGEYRRDSIPDSGANQVVASITGIAHGGIATAIGYGIEYVTGDIISK